LGILLHVTVKNELRRQNNEPRSTLYNLKVDFAVTL